MALDEDKYLVGQVGPGDSERQLAARRPSGPRARHWISSK